MLSADVWPCPEHNVQASVLGNPKVLCNIVPPRKVPGSRSWLDLIPENVREDGIQTHGTCFVQSIVPILVRNSLGAHLPSNNLVRFAM